MTGRQWTLLAMGLAAGAFAVSQANAISNREGGDTWSANLAGAISDYPVLAALPVAVVAHAATPTALPGKKLFSWPVAFGIALLSGVGLGLTWYRYDWRGLKL